MVQDLRQALYASKIVSYAQGYALMRDAARHYGWTLNDGGIALMWRGGCIIRSASLAKSRKPMIKTRSWKTCCFRPISCGQMQSALPAWRRVMAQAMLCGVPVPAMSAALSYFDGYTCSRLPANLLQAQRDYFGAPYL